MIRYCLKKWDKNRKRLEEAIRKDETINECDYDYLMKLVVDYILNDEETEVGDSRWDSSKITCINDGEWQGTLLFLIPALSYQPAEYEYLMTYADYGSCELCDTLKGIRLEMLEKNEWISGPPTEQQVRDYMTLCKDLVSNMIKPYNKGWRGGDEFEPVEG